MIKRLILQWGCVIISVFSGITWYQLNSCLLQRHWRHNERYCVPNGRRHDCLLNRLFRRRSKKTLKLRVTGLCEGNSQVTGEFPAQKDSDSGHVSIWWRHHGGPEDNAKVSNVMTISEVRKPIFSSDSGNDQMIGGDSNGFECSTKYWVDYLLVP